MTLKIGLYGGSFDPVHSGHIQPVLEAKRRLGLERVIYLPTAQPPHKPGRVLAPAHARFTMVELALLDYPDLVVSAHELTPGEASYTVESAEHFAAAEPGAELFLIIGGDSFRDLESWHRWRDLVALCRLAILARPGWETRTVSRSLAPELERLVASGRAIFAENAPVDVSSTHLRQLLAEDKSIPAEMMPNLVVEYVKKYSLYS